MIEYALEIFLFIVCVIFSAFFSSSEVALISMTRAKVRTLDNENRVGSHALVALKESPEHLLTTILIGNNIVNVAAAALATSIAIKMFGDVGIGVATGFVTIILLVFGEIENVLLVLLVGENREVNGRPGEPDRETVTHHHDGDEVEKDAEEQGGYVLAPAERYVLAGEVDLRETVEVHFVDKSLVQQLRYIRRVAGI